MELFKIGTLAFATSILVGCGSGSEDSEIPPLLGPGATEAEAIAAIDALETEVDGVFRADGTTDYTALPTGSATYTGLIYGSEIGGGGSGPDMDYAADLDLTVDFATYGVTGQVYNFVTSITDFNNPAGTIDVTGDVTDGGPDALISFSGNGLLTGTNGVTAEYVVGANGEFGGTDGSVLAGSQETNFNWQTGPDAGTESWSDDGFAATRD
jgi:hypothetical protein